MNRGDLIKWPVSFYVSQKIGQSPKPVRKCQIFHGLNGLKLSTIICAMKEPGNIAKKKAWQDELNAAHIFLDPRPLNWFQR